MTEHDVAMRVNGRVYRSRVADRLTLADHLRQNCHLTGTHLGCEHGVCGTCTVLVDGADVRGCLTLAIQADGAAVTTVEGIEGPDADADLSLVQEAFRRQHGLQCGFCTPGFVVTVTAFLRENPAPTDEEIRDALSGNLCRCTGYQGIIRAVRDAADAVAQPGILEPAVSVRPTRTGHSADVDDGEVGGHSTGLPR